MMKTKCLSVATRYAKLNKRFFLGYTRAVKYPYSTKRFLSELCNAIVCKRGSTNEILVIEFVKI